MTTFVGATVHVHTKISKRAKVQVEKISRATGLAQNEVLNSALQTGLAAKGYKLTKGATMAKKKATKKVKPAKKGY